MMPACVIQTAFSAALAATLVASSAAAQSLGEGFDPDARSDRLAPGIRLPATVELQEDPDRFARHILRGSHPDLAVTDLRQPDRHLKISGMAFLPDGRLVLAAWRPGEVWLVSNLHAPDVAEHEYERIAEEFEDPMGVAVVDGVIYVLHKPGFVVLRTNNKHAGTWSREDLPGGWQRTGNHHEFAFGGVHHDGGLYATLSTGIDGRGRSFVPHAPGRGSLVRFDLATRSLSTLAVGLRAPNGVYVDATGAVWYADNQGDYVPTSKLVRVAPMQEGVPPFYGYAAVLGDAAKELQETPPTVWLPHQEAGRSPSQMVACKWPRWQGQLLLGDVTLGGIRRVQIEDIDGVAQGCVFRLSQGFEAGVNRLVWGPAETAETSEASENGAGMPALYVGGIGSPGDWHQPDKRYFGLAKAAMNNSVTAFEMNEVRVTADGFEIELSKPVDGAFRSPEVPEDIGVYSWAYETTVAYGGPKIDLRQHRDFDLTWSDDGRVFRIAFCDSATDDVDVFMPTGRAYRIGLPEAWRSAEGDELWSRHAWYTLHRRRVP